VGACPKKRGTVREKSMGQRGAFVHDEEVTYMGEVNLENPRVGNKKKSPLEKKGRKSGECLKKI